MTHRHSNEPVRLGPQNRLKLVGPAQADASRYSPEEGNICIHQQAAPWLGLSKLQTTTAVTTNTGHNSIFISTHPSKGNGSGSEANKATLPAVGVGGKGEVVFQGRDRLLDLAVVIHHHQVFDHPGNVCGVCGRGGGAV